MTVTERAVQKPHDSVGHACRITTVLVLIVGFLHLLSTKVAFNDDLMWLYSASFLVDKPAALAEAKALIADGLQSIGADSFLQYRFALRDGFESNYRFNAFAYYLARQLTAPLPFGADLASDRAAQQLLIDRIALGAAIGFAAALALFWIGLSRVRDRILLICVAAVLLGITVVNFLPIYSAPIAINNVVYWSNLTLDHGESLAGAIVATTVKFLVHPGPWFVPYHLAPKNQFQLILIAVFALRWCDRHGTAYAVLAAACVFHHSYAAFIALFLASADAWWQPARFLRPGSLLLAAVPAVANLSRSGGHEDWSLSIFAPAVLFVAVVAVATIRRAGVLGTDERPVILPELSLVGRDLLTFWSVWLVTGAVFASIALQSPPFEARYFWSNIHSRLYGLMLLPTYIGLAYLTTRWLLRHELPLPRWLKSRGQTLLLGSLAGGLLLAVVMLLRHDPFSVFSIEPRNVPASTHCAFETRSGAFEAAYFTQMSADLELNTTGRVRAFFAPCPSGN